MADELDQTIHDNASGPAEAQGDAGRIKQHALGDQIAADRYLQSKKASRKKGLGVALKKLVAPGAE